MFDTCDDSQPYYEDEPQYFDEPFTANNVSVVAPMVHNNNGYHDGGMNTPPIDRNSKRPLQYGGAADQYGGGNQYTASLDRNPHVRRNLDSNIGVVRPIINITAAASTPAAADEAPSLHRDYSGGSSRMRHGHSAETLPIERSGTPQGDKKKKKKGANLE